MTPASSRTTRFSRISRPCTSTRTSSSEPLAQPRPARSWARRSSVRRSTSAGSSPSTAPASQPVREPGILGENLGGVTLEPIVLWDHIGRLCPSASDRLRRSWRACPWQPPARSVSSALSTSISASSSATSTIASAARSSEWFSERDRLAIEPSFSRWVRSARSARRASALNLQGLVGHLALGVAEGDLEAGDDLFARGDLAAHVEGEVHVLGRTALGERGIGLGLRSAITSRLDARVGELGVGDLRGGGAQDDAGHGSDRDQQGRAGRRRHPPPARRRAPAGRPRRSGGCCAGDGAQFVRGACDCWGWREDMGSG